MTGKVTLQLLSLTLFLTIFHTQSNALALADDLPVDYHTNASLYGLQVVRRGELLTFASYWSELIIINLPEQSEYERFLTSINSYCQTMNTAKYEVYENIVPIDIAGKERRAERIRQLISQRCMTVKDDITKTVRDLIQATFRFSLPEPPPADTKPIPMITNFDTFKFDGTDEDQDESIHRSPPFSSLSTDGRNESASVTGRNVSVVSTETSIHSSTFPSTTTVREDTTFAELSSLGPNSTFEIESHDSVEYQNSDIAQTSNTMRKKREIITLSVIAVSAITALFATSAAGVAMAIHNREKISDLEDKVKRLVAISENQDIEATNIREWLMGSTRYSSEKFNETGNTLNGLLKLQKLFSDSINDTARSLRDYSLGDSLSNSLFLNLHEESDFLNRVSSVLESVRRVTKNYELGILSLQNNQLSPSFVNHANLKKILYKVRDALPQGYHLALGMGKLEDYYFYKLVTHTKAGNQLFMRLVIPLSTDGVSIPTSLFTPVFSVVPLPKLYQKQLKLTSNKNFYRISERELLWECRKDKFTEVIDRTHLNCQEYGYYMKCTRYQPTPKIIPSPCIKLLMEGRFDPNEIFSSKGKACRPVMMDSEEYSPIRIQEDEFIIHGSEHLRFRKVLGNKSQSIDIDELTPMKLVRLGNGEQLEVNGNLLPAPIFQAGSKVTLNMSSGIRDIIFTSAENRVPLPSPTALILQSYELNEVDFKPIDTSFPEAMYQKLAEDNERVRERIESYNKTFKFDSLARKSSVLEQTILKHLQTVLIFLVAIHSYKNRNFLVFTSTYFAVIQSEVSAMTIDTTPGKIVSFMSLWTSLPHPDWEIVLQIALLSFIIFNTIFKNIHNKVILHKANGYVMNMRAEFNVSLTYTVDLDTPCYRLQETINIKYPLNAQTSAVDVRTIRCEAETNQSNFKINHHGFFTLSDPFYTFGLSETGQVTFALMPFDVAFDLNNVSWRGNKPFTIDQRQGGSCTILVTRNPYFESES